MLAGSARIVASRAARGRPPGTDSSSPPPHRCASRPSEARSTVRDTSSTGTKDAATFGSASAMLAAHANVAHGGRGRIAIQARDSVLARRERLLSVVVGPFGSADRQPAALRTSHTRLVVFPPRLDKAPGWRLSPLSFRHRGLRPPGAVSSSQFVAGQETGEAIWLARLGQSTAQA